MSLKKKVVSLALAAAMMISVSAPALATSAFNMSVFDGRQDVSISSDDMSGQTSVFLSGDSYSSAIPFDDGSLLIVDSSLFLDDSYDTYKIYFNCFEPSLAGMESIIIKIGDNRYNFSNCYTSQSRVNDNTVMETIAIMMKRETVGFMNDLKDHKDEEIRVRINGTYETLDFSLTDEMKNEILTLYDLYAQGGGTRDSNLRSVTLIDPTIVAKNDKTIDGLAKDKAIDAAIHALL